MIRRIQDLENVPRLNGVYNLADADLEEAVLPNTNLAGANFEGAYLIDANLAGANLEGANFEGASLENTNFEGANLTNANFKDVETMESTKFNRAILIGANLENANGKETELNAANLSGANLTNANMIVPRLALANLQGANLQGARIYAANLRDANLQGVNLQGANLEDGDLTNANLRGADLRGCNLNRTTLVGVLLDETTRVDNTTVYDTAYPDEIVDILYQLHTNPRHPPSVWSQDEDCVGQDDPVSLEPIPAGRGFKLEAENRCYDAATLSEMKRLQRPLIGPLTRIPFTDNDKRRVDDYIRENLRGGKKRKTQKKRKTKKSKRTNKKRTSRRKMKK
jgi:uncharacterized protein YjbI with pentapeptide repeats